LAPHTKTPGGREKLASMTTVFRTIFILGLVIWVGTTVFLSLVVMPTLFLNLESAEAGGIAALLFPPYYLTGLAGGLLMLVAGVALARKGGRGWRYAISAVVVMFVCQAYAHWVVRPSMAEIRGVESAAGEFQRLHKTAVRLNGVVLVGGLALVTNAVGPG
jgi:hypothetical protein